MAITREGAVQLLCDGNTGPDSNGQLVIRLSEANWKPLLEAIRGGDFETGDLVVLKSGGPPMTIIGMHSPGVAYCQYFRVQENEYATVPQKFGTIRRATEADKTAYGGQWAEPSYAPAGGCKVLLLLPCATGRLEAELTMPGPPAAKLQLGRGGSVLIEHVRYAPADSLYVCRCCFVRGDATEQITTREGVEAFIKDDTGLNWEHAET